ncbi:hypothetical protein DESC_880032 [Desulfosarcina cetonica]|uniref:universal stress protein n=1 Tax=Desulfosarcina cetonica TaxID=90730 RepID=UPI0006CF402A|nr:universal stress protein [Desulfosarcina cetonica]VTR71006.1 hypothetical protein DESC_880032 [Desulfosarcina cetonica]
MRNPFRRRAKKNTLKDQPAAEQQLTAKALDAAVPANELAGGVEGRLVVMGNESQFSDEVVDYAIDMARRMSYEIVALNSAPLSCDSFGLFSTSRSKLCDEFQSICSVNGQTFRQAAEAAGIPFVQVVKFDEPEQALSSLQHEFSNIEFVIADSQPQAETTDRIAQTNSLRNEVLVYSMI